MQFAATVLFDDPLLRVRGVEEERRVVEIVYNGKFDTYAARTVPIDTSGAETTGKGVLYGLTPEDLEEFDDMIAEYASRAAERAANPGFEKQKGRRRTKATSTAAPKPRTRARPPRRAATNSFTPLEDDDDDDDGGGL